MVTRRFRPNRKQRIIPLAAASGAGLSKPPIFRVRFRSALFNFTALFMATIKPFAALRPNPELAARICELPYDVMSSEEARQMAAGNPLSFLHVSKPEIDLPRAANPYSPKVYAKAKNNFAGLIVEGALIRDQLPSFYLYQQIMGSHKQVGLVATASC